MLQFASIIRPSGSVGHDRLRATSWTNGHLFALCDGAGGVTGAGEAADLVTDHIVRVAPPPRESTRAFFVDLIGAIDRSTLLAASAGLTTAVVAMVSDGVVQGASVGDSEAWLISDTNEIVLTENQNRKPLVGSRRCSAVAFGPVPMSGTLVIGSDGLFKYCPRDSLLRIARSQELDAIPELLLRATQLPSGTLQDDFSVLVYREAA